MSNESGVEELSNRDQMFQVHDEDACVMFESAAKLDMLWILRASQGSLL